MPDRPRLFAFRRTAPLFATSMLAASLLAAPSLSSGLLAVRAHAAPASADADKSAAHCSAAKLEAVGRLAHDVLACEAKAVRRNRSVDPECLALSHAKHDDRFAAAQAEGGCLTTADEEQLTAETERLVTDVIASLSVGATDVSRRCAARKLRAAANEARELLGCYARSTRAGAAVDEACRAKARADYDRVFEKAEARGGCATRDDANVLDVFVARHTERAVAALAAVCGDELTGPGEQCDVAADENCPGECLPFCACPGHCGNGVLEEPGEECDDGDLENGDGCSELCQLENDRALCAGVPATKGATLGVAPVATGLDHPVGLAAPPLDPRRIFVLEQRGRIRVVRAGVLLDEPFLDITDRVEWGGERGLLGLAFDPDYERNGRFFVNYTDADGDTVVSRFERISADRADTESEKILFAIDQPFPNHNGGQLAFDRAGFLYVGMGDGGSGGDPDERAQDADEVLGKLLRLRVDVDAPPYWRVPAGNPHPEAGGLLGLVWARGLRNPWRFSFDRATDDLYIADVGQGAVEEMDYTPAPRRGGLNYGWDLYEGSTCFEPRPPATECASDKLVFPIHEYGHGAGCSVTGGYVYRGCALPDLRGTYFYSDYCRGFIRTFKVADGAATAHADVTAELKTGGFVVGNTSSFGEDARGEIYIVDHDGTVWKIVPVPDD